MILILQSHFFHMFRKVSCSDRTIGEMYFQEYRVKSSTHSLHFQHMQITQFTNESGSQKSKCATVQMKPLEEDVNPLQRIQGHILII